MLYVSEMYDGNPMETYLLGVFDSLAKAEAAGTRYNKDVTFTKVNLIDWDSKNNIYKRYYDNGCTLTITECELNAYT